MTSNFAFTGPRSLTCNEEWLVESVLADLSRSSITWFVGDAPGVDTLVGQMAHLLNVPLEIFRVTDKTASYQFVKRSKAMVDHVASIGGSLVAFPNKPCPEACYPCASVVGGGSGTWLTIAYATYRKVSVKIVAIAPVNPLPSWLITNQLNLF